ncbi:MAG: hypothetical protein WA871_05255 [Candidatus Acidiferrales bacterium]
MSTLDLRPLSLGEILDRTFTLYRGNFLLFAGISAIPQVLVLVAQLMPALFFSSASVFSLPGNPNAAPRLPNLSPAVIAAAVGFFLVFILLVVFVTMLAQGATVIAVSDLYLGRPTTLIGAFRRVWRKVLTIFAVAVLSGFAMIAGFIFLIVPGIYIACRLALGVQAAVLEDAGPIDALSRSFALTKDTAGRVFLTYVLYGCLLGAAFGAVYFLLGIPLAIGVALEKNNAAMIALMTILPAVMSFLAGALVAPFLMIAMSILYYDTRVRKEGLDVQMMMNRLGEAAPPAIAAPELLS